MRFRLFAALLCLFPFTVDAQSLTESCAIALQPPPTAGHVVSARLLAVPSNAWKHYSRAATFLAIGHPERIEPEATKALTLAPGFAEVYLLRALAADRLGKAAEALPLLASARALAPDLPWLNLTAAEVLNRLGRFDAAILELESIPGAESSAWQVAYERARAETGRRDVEAALHWSALAVASAPPGCTEARLVHANALHLAGRDHEVILELQTFLAEDKLQTRHKQVHAALEKVRASLAVHPADEARAELSPSSLAEAGGSNTL